MEAGLDATFSAEAAAAVLGYLLDLTLKGLVVLALAGIATALFRKAPAATRHLVWCMALCSLLLLPLFSWVAPAWYVPLLPARPVSGPVAAQPPLPPQPPQPPQAPQPAQPPLPAVAPASPTPGAAPTPWAEPALAPTPAPAPVPAPAVAPAAAPATAGGGPPAPPAAPGFSSGLESLAAAFAPAVQAWRLTPLTTWVMLAWLAGVAAILGQLLFGAVGVWRLSRTARPVQEPAWLDLADEVGDRLFLTRPVHLYRSTRTATPMTWGFRRPVVLLPADAESWDDERRRCVLMHEFAHIERWDCLTQTIAQVASAFFWFNPLVWVALRHLRTEREKACDDYVLAHGTRASSYATHLIDIARTVRTPFASPLGAVAMAKPSQLEGRVLAILDGDRARRPVDRGTTVKAALCAAVLVLPLAAMRPWPAAEATPATAPLPAVGANAPAAPDALGSPAAIAGAPQVDDARVRALIEALGDEDASVRERAAFALGDLDAADAVAALAAVLRGDESPGVRRQAAWALGEIGSRQASPALSEALADEDGGVRATAAWALGELGDRQAAPALAQQLASEPEAGARSQMAWALGEIADEDAVPVLVRALGDRDEGVQGKAAWALGEIGDDVAVDGLTGVLGADDEDVRRQAAWALGEIAAPRSVAPLSKALLEDEAAEVRRTAAWALGEIGEPSAAEALTKALKDRSTEVRRMAAWALGELEDAPAHEGRRDGKIGKADAADEATFEALSGQVGRLAAKLGADVARAVVGVGAGGEMTFDFDGDGTVGQEEVDEAVERQIFDIREEDLAEMRALGYRDITVDNLIEARVHGIDAAFIREVRGRGYDPSFPELVQLRALGVDVAYLDELAEAGYDRLTVGELTSLRAMGVDGDYIISLREAGLRQPTVDQIVQLRALNVTPDRIEVRGDGKQ